MLTLFFKIKVCKNGFYNANCTGRCGHCQNGQACDKENGNCLNGCSSNFQTPFCQGVYYKQFVVYSEKQICSCICHT